MFNSSLVPHYGLHLPLRKARGYNRRGAAVQLGDLVRFDLDLSATEATTFDEWQASSGVANFTLPTTGKLCESRYGVVVDLLTGAGADNTLIEVAAQGVVDANIQNGNNDEGSILVPGLGAGLTADQLTPGTGETGCRVLGTLYSDPGADTADTLSQVLFDGWSLGGMKDGVLTYSATYDPASLAAGAERTDDVTVTGLAATDIVVVAPGISFPTASGVIWNKGQVTADSCEILLSNQHASSAFDGASSTWKFAVINRLP